MPYLSKFSLICKTVFTKPFLLISIVPAVAISAVVELRAVVEILVWVFCLDLVTGVFASYFDWKKQTDKKDKWFFGKGEGFSSDKFKKCFVKLITYAATPLIVYKFEHTFLLKTITFKSLTDREIDITSCFIMVFCAIEIYSIFWENLPRCGFNIFEIFKKFVGVYKDAKKTIEE